MTIEVHLIDASAALAEVHAVTGGLVRAHGGVRPCRS